MQKRRKMFFAIPFDSATYNQYESITAKIRAKYPQITTVIGKEQKGESQRYSDIATFKAQNRELNEQFVKQISEADVVVADLTHNNPNVHVELGIALMNNKNILRVTGRGMSDIGFDVRNLEVKAYRNEKDLLHSITAYLDMFLEIKSLPLLGDHKALYRCLSEPKQLRAFAPDSFERIALVDLSPDLLLRDGAVSVKFKILRAFTPDDWLGVCFRVAGTTPWEGCHMVYVRQNGRVEVAVYPGPKIVKVHDTSLDLGDEQALLIEFENDTLRVEIGRNQFETETLTHQRAGRIVLVALRSDVEITSAEAISRDTIEWN
ncbi:MAG: hypothetical protein ACM3WP_02205 [Acidobacteriota bacterium]